MLFNKNNRQPGPKDYLVAAFAALVFAIVFVVFVGPLVECTTVLPELTNGGFKSFDSTIWKAHREQRIGMLYDLLFWHKLDNLTRDQIIVLLGNADWPGPRVENGNIVFEEKYVLSEANCLAIYYDKNKRVQHVFVLAQSNS
jgi:hypothetical protein